MAKSALLCPIKCFEGTYRNSTDLVRPYGLCFAPYVLLCQEPKPEVEL